MSDTTLDVWDADAKLPEPRTNKPLTLRRRIEAALFFAFLKVMGSMSVERASGFAGKLVRTLGPLLRSVHHRGEANLRLIYPDMTAAERSAILRDAWDNIGRTMAEYAHLENMAERVTVENVEGLRAYAEEGKQAIFVSGHFANWEVLGAVIRREGVKFAAVYRAPNNALVDRHIIQVRAKAMTRYQIPKGKRGGRELLSALKSGLSLTMVTDQKLNDGIEVPLLGHPAMTAPAPARLAKKHNIPIVPLQLVRLPGARFAITVHDPIEPGDRSVEDLTREVNDILGEFILARPEQWLWFHRRWPADLTPA
ncbi:lysophospholipid acyltransferase family protein [Parvularcula sp. ZS-1/3]|uniref:Lysophospholipid acyltransferase family protein n=1 Tax=Parvularcula mediterranea TaxID=2732508 RepID=A0A7Y3W5A3_9PROT|nr:lysophospholipid acyltransferase family protein [Parvularcula mediterranea]NNU16404.1 lysophospholipid acyltransferase family protein [Parvularcula mediterranea]